MANRSLGPFLSGLTSGFLQGSQMARQKTLDTVAAEHQRRQMALQEQLAQSLMEDRRSQEKRLKEKDLQASYETPIDRMLSQAPELATDLAEVSGYGRAYAAAPPASPVQLGGGAYGPTQIPGQDFYESQRAAALQAAGKHAEQIRKNRELHDLTKINESADARARMAFEQISARSREAAIRSVASAAATGRITLPDGATADIVVDNILTGGSRPELLPTVPMNRAENETMAAIDAVEFALQEMSDLKRGTDTGPLSGRVNRLKAKFNVGNRAMNKLDAISIRNKFAEVKAQSGAQYGMKELEQLEKMVPDNTVNDIEWWDRWKEALKFHQNRKAALLRGFRSMRKLPPDGVGSGRTVYPTAPMQMPEGFIPE